MNVRALKAEQQLLGNDGPLLRRKLKHLIYNGFQRILHKTPALFTHSGAVQKVPQIDPGFHVNCSHNEPDH